VNIAGVVDVEKVAERLKDYPGVAFSTIMSMSVRIPASR